MGIILGDDLDSYSEISFVGKNTIHSLALQLNNYGGEFNQIMGERVFPAILDWHSYGWGYKNKKLEVYFEDKLFQTITFEKEPAVKRREDNVVIIVENQVVILLSSVKEFNYLEIYKGKLKELQELIACGNRESERAYKLESEMDKVWKFLSNEEIESL